MSLSLMISFHKSHTVQSMKEKNENAKKYYTNEVTNQKYRSPNKCRGNSKLPEKEFRILIVKKIKNLENKMEKML